jgi:hypothetical protein
VLCLTVDVNPHIDMREDLKARDEQRPHDREIMRPEKNIAQSV